MYIGLLKSCIFVFFFSLLCKSTAAFVKMEAKALHDFNATATDELSFRKNDKLKVLIFFLKVPMRSEYECCGLFSGAKLDFLVSVCMYMGKSLKDC